MRILFLLFFTVISCNVRDDIHVDNSLFIGTFKSLDKEHKIIFLDSVSDSSKKFSDDTIKLDRVFKIAAEYYYLKKYKSSFAASKYAKNIAIKLKDSFSIGRANYYMGDCFMDYQKDSAYYYYKESEKIFRLIKNEDRLAKVHYNKAFLLFYEGNYTESEIEVIKAMHYLKNTDNLVYKYYTNSLQGSNHLELGEYEKALSYFNQATEILHKMQIKNIDKDKFYDYNITNIIDICTVYDKKGDYSKSIIELKNLIDSYNFTKFPQLQHAVLGNLGYSLMKNKNYNESKYYLEKAIDLAKKDKNNQAYLYKIIDFGEYKLLTNDTLEAKKLFNEALVLSKKLRSGKEVLKTLNFLSKVDRINEYQYQNEYIKVNDSIVKRQRENREKFSRIEYETNKIEDANKSLNNRNLFLLLLLTCTIIIFLIIQIIRNRIARKTELFYKIQKELADNEILNITKEFQTELVNTKLQEQNRISKELHDGIVNQIYGIRMILGSLNMKSGEEVQHKRSIYIKELHKLETEIRTLSHQLNSDFSNYVAEFNFLLEQLVKKNNEIGVTHFSSDIQKDINWDDYSSVVKINLYRILQELFLNVNKYAFAENCQLLVRKLDDKLVFEVRDDGVGFNSDVATDGIGLKNIKARVKTLNAHIRVQSNLNEGTKFIILI